VVKVDPEPRDVPPLAALNHEIVPADAVALNETVPVPQLAPGVVEETVGIGLIVANTAVLVPATHPFTLAASA
jgi:hypothetical protein